MVWAIATGEPVETLEQFRDELGLELPILLDEDGQVHHDYIQEMPFPTGAYPQQWVIGVDGTIQYFNNRFEADQVIEVIERELEKTE